MTRFIHLLAVIVVISAVTTGLKIDTGKTFLREFAKSTGMLTAFYVGLGVLFFLIAWFMGNLN